MVDFSPLLENAFNPLETLQAYGRAHIVKLEGLKAQRQENEYQRGEAKRVGLMNAYNPTTGAIDAPAARQAYMAGGDVPGAIAFDAAQGKSKVDTLKSQLEIAQATTGLLSSATDPTSYAAARARAQAMGLDISGVPEQFDPQWVQTATMQSLDAKDRLAAQLARENADRTEAARLRDDARADRTANHTIANADARLGLAYRADARSNVRFKERDKDRAALAASGGIRTDLSDLDY